MTRIETRDFGWCPDCGERVEPVNGRCTQRARSGGQCSARCEIERRYRVVGADGRVASWGDCVREARDNAASEGIR